MRLPDGTAYITALAQLLEKDVAHATTFNIEKIPWCLVQLLRGANENIREALIQVLEGKVPETLQKKPEVEKDEIDEKEEPSSQSGNDAPGLQT